MTWSSIGELVREAAARNGTAVIEGDQHVSFKELADRIEHAARAVAATGIKRGDAVAIWAPNSLAWIQAALGAVTAGAALVPINTRFKGQETTFLLEKSRARLLFTVKDFLGTNYIELLKEAGHPPALEHVADIDNWMDASHPASTHDEAGPTDVSDIIFTSGTTGKPKGVVVTHEQTLRVFDVWSREVGLEEGDRYLVVNPFFHTFGYKAGILACLMRGATIVPHAVFDARAVMQRIVDEKITVLPGAPTLYQSMLNEPDRPAMPSLRLAVTGAAVVPVELVRRMRDELGFETVLTAYGLTEATGVVTMCRRGDDLETIANTSGRAILDTEVKLVDDSGFEVGPGYTGEVLVRGYNVMQGYFEEPKQTAEAIDAEGWLHTGDVGVRDEAGNVRITDRKKDMLITGGFNVYPAEVENALLAHTAIAQAAVVDAPDERLGEIGIAFVVASSGVDADPDEILTWLRKQIANYKVPRQIEIVDALPLNASGKVLKFELRERARALVAAR